MTIVLLVAGIIAICLEVFVPGGILGIIGGICIVASTVMAYESSGILNAVLVFGAGGLFSILGVLFELKVLSKTAWVSKLFLQEQVLGKAKYMEASEELIGQRVETITPLAPTGKVKVQGKLYEVFSIDGFLDKGVLVEIVGYDNFRLLVKKIQLPK